MLELRLSQLSRTTEWEAAGVKLPNFDVEAIQAETVRNPV